MNGSQDYSKQFRFVGLLAVGTLLVAITGILLFSAGVTDPFPANLEAPSLPVFELAPRAGAPTDRWFSSLAPPAHVRLEASLGTSPAAFALLAGEPARHVAVGLSNEGTVGVWLREDGENHYLLPWQPWPHARIDSGPQEIHLERNGDALTAWINREQLWSGTVAELGPATGVQGLDFAGSASVRVESLVLAER